MYDGIKEFDSFTGQSMFANQPPAEIRWFNLLLSNRFKHANLYWALIASTLFYLAVVFHQIALLRPVDSLLNLIYLLFFPTFWLSVGCVFVFSYCLSWFFILKCFHPLYETNYNIAKFQVIMAVLGIFFTNLVFLFFVVFTSLTTVYNSWTTFTLFASTAFFASYQTALGTNFRWECAKVSTLKRLCLVWRPILREGCGDLARNVARGYMLATPLCVLLPVLRSTFFDLVFALSTNVSNFFLIFVLQSGVRLMFELINAVTMQPINLPLIGQSLYMSKQSQQQNLISAITSENDLLREFGFRALNDLARKSRMSRELIFSLSQPGKKPRNWMTIYEVCTRITEVTREMLQVSTSYIETNLGADRNIARLGLNLRPVNTPTIRPMARRQFEVCQASGGERGNTSNGSANGTEIYSLNQSKHLLLLPPHLNPRTQASRSRPRFFRVDLSMLPGYSKVEHWVFAFWSTFLRPTPKVSSYYLKLTGYCLDTLSVLAACSIVEDDYGIVQDDLSTIISTFLQLELAIDLYIRSTSNNKSEYTVRDNLHSLEEILQNSLKQIHASFEPHIDSLNLDESQRKLLNVLVFDL